MKKLKFESKERQDLWNMYSEKLDYTGQVYAFVLGIEFAKAYSTYHDLKLVYVGLPTNEITVPEFYDLVYTSIRAVNKFLTTTILSHENYVFLLNGFSLSRIIADLSINFRARNGDKILQSALTNSMVILVGNSRLVDDYNIVKNLHS